MSRTTYVENKAVRPASQPEIIWRWRGLLEGEIAEPLEAGFHIAGDEVVRAQGLGWQLFGGASLDAPLGRRRVQMSRVEHDDAQPRAQLLQHGESDRRRLRQP